MKRLIVIALAMLSIHSTYAEKLALVGSKIHTMSEQGVMEILFLSLREQKFLQNIGWWMFLEKLFPQGSLAR